MARSASIRHLHGTLPLSHERLARRLFGAPSVWSDVGQASSDGGPHKANFVERGPWSTGPWQSDSSRQVWSTCGRVCPDRTKVYANVAEGFALVRNSETIIHATCDSARLARDYKDERRPIGSAGHSPHNGLWIWRMAFWHTVFSAPPRARSWPDSCTAGHPAWLPLRCDFTTLQP